MNIIGQGTFFRSESDRRLAYSKYRIRSEGILFSIKNIKKNEQPYNSTQYGKLNTDKPDWKS